LRRKNFAYSHHRKNNFLVVSHIFSSIVYDRAKIKKVSELKAEGISPKLAILRVGSRADDLAYEKGAVKKMADIGIECEVHELAPDVSQADFEAKFNTINSDSKVHGILMFRPLPKH